MISLTSSKTMNSGEMAGGVIIALTAYLLGSFPTGYLVARAKGIDIRAVGSGNIGATNAMRVLGKPAGVLVLLVDCAKGFIACCFGAFVGVYFVMRLNGIHPFDEKSVDLAQAFSSFQNLPIIAGIFAVLGHNYTCWLKFKGGKGIATTAGVYLALAPTALGIAFAVFLLAVLATRYMSVGSICAAIALPVAVWILPPHNLSLGIVTTALGVLAVFKHRKNIQRLIAGTESRLGQKSSTEAAK